MEKHIIYALVEDRPGVMQRISGLFTRRNFNIDTISVGRSEKKGISRISLSVRGSRKDLEQVMKQLSKIIEVRKVVELKKDTSVARELALVKIATKDEDQRAEVIQYVNIFRGRIVDVSKDSMVVEITGDSAKVDAFLQLVKTFGLKELAKTGITAMSR